MVKSDATCRLLGSEPSTLHVKMSLMIDDPRGGGIDAPRYQDLVRSPFRYARISRSSVFASQVASGMMLATLTFDDNLASSVIVAIKIQLLRLLWTRTSCPLGGTFKKPFASWRGTKSIFISHGDLHYHNHCCTGSAADIEKK